MASTSGVVLVLCLLAVTAYADVYLHMPRGSNNRLDDQNRDRDNANRMFDSQNNNRGGNNVGQIYYFTDSIVPFEWTNQHSCGNPNNNCEMIIQYMCDSRIRDGTTTTTIPDKPTECYNFDCDTDVRFGRHESYDWYQQCKYRQRNQGLFNANQNLQGKAAIYTRQNPNGARRGYECPEERDYYPYWHPSPWKDIAILTNQPQRCEAYVTESQNVKSRFYCVPPTTWAKAQGKAGQLGFIPITQTGCEKLSAYNAAANKTEYGTWTEYPAWNIPPPVCHENVWSRDNHLGNVAGGFPAGFNWTVPSHTVSEQCVIRLRYNISTNDLGPRETANFQSATSVQSSDYLNSTLNRSPSTENKDPAAVDMWSKFKLSFSDVAVSFDKTKNGDTTKLKASREYVLKNNPKVDIFGSLLQTGGAAAGAQLKFQLAVNTAQYGRTFQDRTHKFAIRSRPATYGSAAIYNLQVKGKRGNIVQTYPGTEYDFHPNRLEVRNGDYIHFQWTGSNTNPDNNAGQGRQGSDRHNVLMLRPKVYDEKQGVTSPTTYGQWGRSYPDRIDTPGNGVAFLGFNPTLLKQLAVLNTPQGQFGGELSELDDAGTYFDLLPQQVTQNGIYHYMCTRNNNFSNRGQKGKIVVSDSAAKVEAVGWAGATVQGTGNTMVVVEQGALSALVFITIENKPPGSSSSFSEADSDFVNVQPYDLSLTTGSTVTVVVPYNENAVGSAAMYYSKDLNGAYSKIDASFSDGKATTQTTQGGFFVVKTTTNWAAIIGITIAVLVVIGVATFFIYRRYKAKRAAEGNTRNVALNA